MGWSKYTHTHIYSNELEHKEKKIMIKDSRYLKEILVNDNFFLIPFMH